MIIEKEIELTVGVQALEYVNTNGFDSCSIEFRMLKGSTFNGGVISVRKTNAISGVPVDFTPTKAVSAVGFVELTASDWQKASYLVLQCTTSGGSAERVQAIIELKKNDHTSLIDPVDAVTTINNDHLDAFSRLRVSNPVSLFASQCQYDAEPLLWETGATGTGIAGSHSANTRMVALSATAGTGTSFIQSYEYVPYQPGKSQLAFCTGLLGAAVADAIVDVGIFDADNGVFYRQDGTDGLAIVLRSSTSGSAVNNSIPQTNWNRDRLDGTGASGKTLDVTKVFILVIDAQFLAMGRVRVGFDIDGVICWAHEFLNANVLAVPYMQTLSLPVQMLLTTTSASSKTAYFKCASVSSEGGLEDDLAYQFSTPEQTVTAADGTRTHILSLRPLTSFNSITNRMKLNLLSMDIAVTGSSPIRWELAIGSAYSAGPTFSSVDATYSAMQYSSAVGTVSSVGIVIASGYVAASNQSKGDVSAKINERYPITLDRSGAVRANGTLSLFVTGIGGASASRASMTFSEIR